MQSLVVAMVSSCPEQGPPQVYQCLGGQFPCAPKYYSMFSPIVYVTHDGGWGVDVGVF